MNSRRAYLSTLKGRFILILSALFVLGTQSSLPVSKATPQPWHELAPSQYNGQASGNRWHNDRGDNAASRNATQSSLYAAVTVAVWDFEDSDLLVDSLDALLPAATLATGPGLSAPTYETGNAPTPGKSVEHASWSTSGCGADDYLELALDLSNLTLRTIEFDEQRSATGPKNYQIQYAVNMGGFTSLTNGAGTTTGSFGPNPMKVHTIIPGSVDDLAMAGQPDVRLRIYGCDAGGDGGKWRIDNLTLSGESAPTAIDVDTFVIVPDHFVLHISLFLSLVTALFSAGCVQAGGRQYRCRRPANARRRAGTPGDRPAAGSGSY